MYTAMIRAGGNSAVCRREEVYVGVNLPTPTKRVNRCDAGHQQDWPRTCISAGDTHSNFRDTKGFCFGHAK